MKRCLCWLVPVPSKPLPVEQNRQRMDRSRSNSRGGSVLSKRIDRRAEIEMEELTPIRPRSGSVGFIDTPISMGPATQTIQQLGSRGRRGVGADRSNPMMEKKGEVVDLLYPEPLEWCYTLRDSVSTDAGEDSASTSIIMEPDYVVLDLNTNTVLQPTERNDEPPLPALPAWLGYGGLFLELTTRPSWRGWTLTWPSAYIFA